MQGLASDIVDASSRLPWWVNLIFACIAYLVMNNYAIDPGVEPATKGFEVGTMGAFAVKHLYGYLAYWLQFVLPFVFGIAALVSIIKSSKFSPTRKWLGILTLIGLGIASVYLINGKIEERKAREALVIEAQDVHKRYLENRLEELKKKTIAEAKRKNFYPKDF